MSIVMRLIPASIAAKPLPRAAQIITLLSIFATVLLATANLLAQQQTQDLGEASLEELANITVYTASRYIQKVTDAPSSVTVITRDEIHLDVDLIERVEVVRGPSSSFVVVRDQRLLCGHKCDYPQGRAIEWLGTFF